MYLAGFALTLGFVITRLIELIHRLVTEEEKQISLNKRIAELEKRTSRSVEDDTEGQSGIRMTTKQSDQLSSNGLRRRAGGDAASIST